MAGWLSRFLPRQAGSKRLRATRIICGLGNPGPEYEATRHNIGYRTVALLGQRCSWQIYRNLAKVCLLNIAGEQVLLVQPLTFMNLSGKAVSPLLRDLGLSPKELLVIYDDLDLSLGRLRVRSRGSSGGHRGVQSLIDYLGSEDFSRIRIGIGRPKTGLEIVDYVLTPFLPADEEIISETLELAVAAAVTWVKAGTEVAMNRYNKLSPGSKKV